MPLGLKGLPQGIEVIFKNHNIKKNKIMLRVDL
jgi:hypothetical protein